MADTPELQPVPELPEEIINAGLDGELILFVGAGVSMQAGLPSWDGLAANVLDDLQAEGCLDYAQLEQLKKLDPKKQLTIAYQIADENTTKIDLIQHLNMPSGDLSIYKYINEIGCSCVTSNYDELLAPVLPDQEDGAETIKTGERVITITDDSVAKLNKLGTVVHIHGAISDEDSMVVTTKKYLQHYDRDNIEYFLKDLFSSKVILFIGYSLEEAEILEHILRRGHVHKEVAERRRFVLLGYFSNEEYLYQRLHKYYHESFGVHSVGFLKDKNGYGQLVEIMKQWSKEIVVRPPALVNDLAFMDEVLGDA